MPVNEALLKLKCKVHDGAVRVMERVSDDALKRWWWWWLGRYFARIIRME